MKKWCSKRSGEDLRPKTQDWSGLAGVKNSLPAM